MFTLLAKRRLSLICEVWVNSISSFFVCVGRRIFDPGSDFWMLLMTSFQFDRRVVGIFDYSGWANVMEHMVV